MRVSMIPITGSNESSLIQRKNGRRTADQINGIVEQVLAVILTKHPELVPEFEQMLGSYNEDLRGQLHQILFKNPVLRDSLEKIQQSSNSSLSEFLTVSAILENDWPEPEWAVPGLLPVGLTILAGPPKVGKSWMALQLSKSVASGGEFLRQKGKPGSVVYFALEDSPQRLKQRMIAQRWEEKLPVHFLTVRNCSEQVEIFFQSGGEKLRIIIEQNNIRLLIVDTLSRAFRGDQHDVQVMTRSLAPIQQMAQDAGCSIVIIDHHRKGNGSAPDAIADILGSTAKGGVADTTWGLYRSRGERIAKLSISGRDVEEKNLNVFFDPTSHIWNLDETGGINQKPQLIAILDCLQEMGPMSLKQLADKLDELSSTTYKRLKSLEEKGLVEQVKQNWSLVKPDVTAEEK